MAKTNETKRPTAAERANVRAFEAELRKNESAARLRNAARRVVNVPALIVQFRAEAHPAVDTRIAVEWFATLGTDAHWAGLAARAGSALPGPDDRARVLLALRSSYAS